MNGLILLNRGSVTVTPAPAWGEPFGTNWSHFASHIAPAPAWVNPFDGMTLQKIAATVGVSHMTVHRAVSDLTNVNSEVVNERGQLRPMHYAARAVDTPVRMPPTAPRTGAALRLPVFSTYRILLFPRRTAYSGLPYGLSLVLDKRVKPVLDCTTD